MFELLNRMPLQWPALHEPAARHLLSLSLRFHKLVAEDTAGCKHSIRGQQGRCRR